MDIWLIWFIAGAVAAVLEIAIPGFYMLTISAACIGGCIASLLSLSLIWQMVFALAFLLAFSLLLRPLLYKSKGGYSSNNKIIGKTVTITKDVLPPDKGRGMLSGVDWAISSDEEIKAGEKARVESVGGAVLHVRKLNKEESGC